MTTALLIAAGGALGALARHYGASRLADWTNSGAFGIFVVNIAGAFLIGLFLTMSEDRLGWAPEWRFFVVVGFLGAFTTFSTLAWDSLQFAEAGDMLALTANLAGSIVVGMAAVYAGASVARVSG